MNLVSDISSLLSNIDVFCSKCSGLDLRSYQSEPAQSIIRSILDHSGYSFVVIFPRQSGKNELQAQLITYLLLFFSSLSAEIVSISPTWRPQCYNAMYRLQTTLENNFLTEPFFHTSRGHIFQIGKARCYFLSGSPTSSVVGLTASTLLMVDEAQDIDIAKFDKDILPMAASSNATRVFFGTAWSSNTLLAREYAFAKSKQTSDGIRRVWRLSADQVSSEVPYYGEFVAEQISKLGRQHPMVKTQYFSEDIDAEGGLFPPERVLMMKGNHVPLENPLPGHVYVFSLDFAGEDEVSIDGYSLSSRRDFTALTIAQVELTAAGLPSFSVVFRKAWHGVKHTSLYSVISSLIRFWHPKYVVCDATGVGAGITSFLSSAFKSLVIPFIFNFRSKSDLAWSFLSLIDSGRYKDYFCPSGPLFHLQNTFFRECEFCQYEVQPGPDKRIRWSVPDNTSDPINGEIIHDDLLVSAALLSSLVENNFAPHSPGVIIPGSDPLSNMKDF